MTRKMTSGFTLLLIALMLVTALAIPRSVAAEGEIPDTPGLPEAAGDVTEAGIDALQTAEPGQEIVDDETVETLTDVVAALAEEGVTLVDESGAPIPLASEEASAALTGDPYVVRGGVTYRFLPVGGCAAFGGVGPTCSESTTPIQAAVTFAADGEVVVIETGTYVEQVIISGKNITLQASGNVVLQAPNALAANYGSAPNLNRGIIFVENATNVVIDGLEVDGLGKGNANYRIYGILYHNAGGAIINNEIHGIRDNPWGGNQHGNAIYVMNDDGVARSIEIANNDVYDFQKNGIVANSIVGGVGDGALTADIHDNTITGQGITGVNGQNGIQMWGSQGTIQDNILSDFVYYDSTHTGWMATCILVLDPGGEISVLGNQASNCDGGLVIQSDTDSIIQDNIFEDSLWGMSLYYSYAPVIVNNIIRDNLYTGVYLYDTIFAYLSGNQILNNGEGVTADETEVEYSGGTVLRNNSIVGNGTGVANYTGFEVDAMGNWWGCPTGADTPGCDTTFDVNTQASPTGDVLTDEPLTQNPFTGGGTFGGALASPIIPVTGARMMAREIFIQVGQNGFAMHDVPLVTIYHVMDGDNELARVTLGEYAVPMDAETNLETLEQADLATLPDEAEYVGPAFHLTANNSQGGAITTLDQAAEIRFILPDGYTVPGGMQLAILFYDETTSEWVTLPSIISNNEVYAFYGKTGIYTLALIPVE